MGRYVLARLGSSVVVFFAITLLVWVAFFALPRPRNLTGQHRSDPFAVHGSLLGSYGRYVWALVRHGDLGHSTIDREDVRTKLGRAAPVTISLILGGTIVWLAIAVSIGLAAALRPRSLLDRAGTIFVLIGLSLHPVWLSLVLSYVFGHSLHVLPPAGYCSINNVSTGCDGLGEWAYHLLLPCVTFGVVNAALFASMLRALVVEQLSEEYVRTARAKGADEKRVLLRHVLRHVAPPIVTMLGVFLGTAIGSVVFVESAFDLPGLGGLLRQATTRRDLPMIAGSVVCLALVVLVLNLLVDLVYGAFDPRVRKARSRPQPAVALEA
jgi:peptide/nickel transport system permease protein